MASVLWLMLHGQIQKQNIPPLFFLHGLPSHLHLHCFNNLLVGYSISMLERGYDWSIIRTCFINHQWIRDCLESQDTAERGLRRCIPPWLWETWLHSGNRCLCWLLHMCDVMRLWLHWCSASPHMLAALPWAGCLQPRIHWGIQQLGQLTPNTLHCTWQLGDALNQTGNSSSREWFFFLLTLMDLLLCHNNIWNGSHSI